MALCNYSGTVAKFQQLEIDFNDVYVLRVGYTTNFYDFDSI